MVRGGKRYPVKTTINLAQRERKRQDLRAVIPTAIVLAVAITLFCKFGVIDRLRTLNQAEAQASRQETLLAETRQRNQDYAQVLEKYRSSSVAQSTTGGGPDSMECLNLIEHDLLNQSQVSSFTVSSGTITVKLSGVTLDRISSIYSHLMASSLVSGVQVYTAATGRDQSGDVTATMTVRLVTEKLAEIKTDGGKGAVS